MTKISNQYSLTNILTADLANSRLGINNVSPTVALDVTGAGKFSSSATALKYIANSQATYASLTYEETFKYASSPAGIWFGNSFNSNNNVALQLRTSNDGTSVQALTITPTGNVGIGTTSPTYNLQINSSGTSSIIHLTNSTTGALTSDGGLLLQSGLDMTFTNREAGRMSFETSNTERMRITSGGNVGIGNTAFANTRVTITGISTTSSNYGLVVNNSSNANLFTVRDDGLVTAPTINASTISASGTLSSAALSTSQVLYAANLTTFNYAGSLALTVPNALNSGSVLADIRMYMIWATGFGDASHAGARIWLMIMNGNGTAYSATELLGRDTDGGTGLSISRSAVNQITISSNGYGFIKSVSCMQLITN